MASLLALTVLVAARLTIVLAQTPVPALNPQSPTTRLLPISGSLTDASGAPLTGTVTVTFTLYDAADNGAGLWSETQQVQADDGGRYAAYLGVVTPVPQLAFSQEQARWLGVEVAGHQLPRLMLVAVPYALRAADAETLGGTPLSSFVTRGPKGRSQTAESDVVEPLVDGSGVPGQLAKFSSSTVLSSSTITETLTNRIGVRTTDPTGGGVVDAVFTIRNLDNNTGFAVLNQANERRFALNTTFSGGWTLYDGANGTWNEGLQQQNGRVGVGGLSGGKLNVFNFASNGDAVTASASSGEAVRGSSGSGTGVVGTSTQGIGVNGSSASNIGVSGLSGSGTGVRGQSSSGLAGQFSGNVTVSGTLTKGGGSFTIDHPLDPANKYLQHSFVESPDMLNVYNGNVTLDSSGEATVTLPDWFEALNGDFRYQLTAVGAPGPNLFIAEEVAGNRFKIAGGPAHGKVSWQVTGIRRDAWARAHPIHVEVEKPAQDRGFYLHPEAFGRPAAMALPSLRAPKQDPY